MASGQRIDPVTERLPKIDESWWHHRRISGTTAHRDPTTNHRPQTPMNIFHLLIILLIGFPLIEITLLIEVGGSLGVFPTIALVVLTAVVGAMLVRAQGFATLRRARRSMDAGELPAIEMIESVFLLLAGALLLAPGFVTDAFGFLFLIPPLRQALIMRLIRSGRLSGHPQVNPEPIEGEYQRHDDEMTTPSIEDTSPLEKDPRDRDDLHHSIPKK